MQINSLNTPGDQLQLVQITVCTLRGQAVQTSREPGETVNELKRFLAREHGLAEDQQRIFQDGQELSGDCVLRKQGSRYAYERNTPLVTTGLLHMKVQGTLGDTWVPVTCRFTQSVDGMNSASEFNCITLGEAGKAALSAIFKGKSFVIPRAASARGVTALPIVDRGAGFCQCHLFSVCSIEGGNAVVELAAPDAASKRMWLAAMFHRRGFGTSNAANLKIGLMMRDGAKDEEVSMDKDKDTVLRMLERLTHR
jgi:hypothetical protein